MRYNELTFAADWLSARHDDGSALRFTRKERAVLRRLVERAPHLVTRAALLDLLAEDGADPADRNIDFVVNRLRGKLGDAARAPRYIATQYGEGYYWVATASGNTAGAASTVDAGVAGATATQAAQAPVGLMIGPVHGIAPDSIAADLPAILGVAIRAAGGLDHAVPSVPVTCSQAECDTALAAARYSLEVSCHIDTSRQPTRLHVALVLHHRPSRHVVQTFRTTVPGPADSHSPMLRQVAHQVLAAMWKHGVPLPGLHVPSEKPLELRMHETALMLAASPDSWRESEQRIAQARALTPDDPMLDVMEGLALFTRLILEGTATHGEWLDIEARIETLALRALPRVQDNPLLVLSVARLLFFVERDHTALAEQLAQDAFERSTAFAAAFGTLAPMRMAAGRFEEALRLYDEGIRLAEVGSEFRISLMVMKCVALLASDDRGRLDAACAELYVAKPLTRMQIGLFMAPPPPAPLPPDLQQTLQIIDRGTAQRMLRYAHMAYARHFRAPEHRHNMLKGIVGHFEQHYGADIVPPLLVQARQAYA
ncbi:helix-turn-helix domain-containing protein [Bordetella sp. N]|uniref:winged helix-turn-helix domain-containing protein n=1 Tax=Bordetella sp. N TaxID=1746199 RepID=UPI00070F3B93|nr:helix-turn-helix domain-containing protein [Bordetella sp. N]ALM84879.1 hypothetical protein ASB57_19570 [Bordetella sp. N]